jgi:hypothetical protein
MKLLTWMGSSLLAAGLIFGSAAMAQSRTYTIPMNNKEFKGTNQRIRIKNSLSAAYPRMDFSDSELQYVVIYAKSRVGNGSAELIVGDQSQDRKSVPDAPSPFFGNAPASYNPVRLNNYRLNNHAAWNILLDGNIKVLKIEVRLRGVDDSGPGKPGGGGGGGYVNIGQGSAVKILPTTSNFSSRYNDTATAIRISVRDNFLVITDVQVEYNNGNRRSVSGFKDAKLFAGQSKEVAINAGRVRRVWVTSLTASPFGPDATYRVSLKTR